MIDKMRFLIDTGQYSTPLPELSRNEAEQTRNSRKILILVQYNIELAVCLPSSPPSTKYLYGDWGKKRVCL